ncbi:hypothetical protein Adt_41821 [Abeliophyllum distichum]|uniref:Uncharacterized protein n=1 Tax=Abeliophyllum distichum TaxID=126358 RepID=A0ABD1PQ10_9LAMI
MLAWQLKRAIDELAGMVSRKLSLEDELAGLKKYWGAQIFSLEDRLENCHLEIKMATRAFLMNDYKNSELTSWDVDTVIACYSELCRILSMRNMLEEQLEDGVRCAGPTDDDGQA